MSSLSVLDSFQGEFSAPEFMEKLCAEVQVNNTDTKEFDPIPYINVIESSIFDMKKFYLTVDKRVETLSLSLETESGEVRQKSEQIAAAFDEIFAAFQRLNLVSDKISATAIRIGRQLEAIQKEKKRAEEAREILRYFMELNATGRCSRLDTLLNTATTDSKLASADLLRKLYQLAVADIPGTEKASLEIKHAYSEFESEMVSVFMAAFESGDLEAMKASSSVLIQLNNASSCIKIFIEKHAFFKEPYNCNQIQHAFFTKNERTRIPIDFSLPIKFEDELVALFDLILRTVSADWKYLDEVFESPKTVMDMLLKKVFDEIIMQHIDEGLKAAGTHSTVMYLRYLSWSYCLTCSFVDQLVTMYIDHIEESSPLVPEGAALESIRTHLMELHAEIFERYIKPEDVQLLETRFLKEILDICSLPIKNFVTSKRVDKASKALFNISSASESDIVPDKEIVNRTMFYLFKDGTPLLRPKECESGLINEVILMRILRLVSDALARMKIFYSDKQVLSDIVENYLCFFFEGLFKACLQRGVQYALDNQDVGMAQRQLDPKNFILVQTLNNLLGIMQAFFEEQLLPLSSSVSVTCSRKISEKKNAIFSAVLKLINELVNMEIGAISSNISGCISKYAKKSDFKPKPDDVNALGSSTQFCTVVREYLKSCVEVLHKYLPAGNATKAASRIGRAFFELLVDLIRKLSISDMGGMVLLNDVNSYIGILSAFGEDAQRELQIYFGFLREIANLMMVKPENLRSVLQEGTLNLIDVRLLYPFITLRADFKTNSIDTLFPDMTGSATTSQTLGLGFF